MVRLFFLTLSSQSSFTARLLGFRSWKAIRESISMMRSPLPTGAEDAYVWKSSGREAGFKAVTSVPLPVYTESKVTVNHHFSYKLRLRSELDAILLAPPTLQK